VEYRIVHELPHRVRITLSIPGRHGLDASWVEQIKGMDGIRSASFNRRTQTLLVTHRGDRPTRDALLSSIKNASLVISKKEISEASAFQQKRKAVITSGALLLASPLIPLKLAPFIAAYGAMPFLKKGIRSLREKRLNVNVLDSSALSVAVAMGDYRTAGTISFLLKLGDYMEERTRERSRRSIRDVFAAPVEHVWLKRAGKEVKVNARELSVGDMVIVRTGSRIPVDGQVVEGEAMVNQSSMTGEPLPVAKRKGLTVYAGTAVEEGSLVVEAEKVGDATRVSRIIKVIEGSEHHKADVQTHAERLAEKLVPYSFLLSGLTYALTGSAVRAAAVLLVDYSCAIRLSTTLSIMSGMIRSGKRGVLIKGGRFIEKLSRADVFVLDKTGTLTESSPDVMNVFPVNGYSRDYILRQTACVEEHFPHPVATAIVKRARDEGVIHAEEHGEVEHVLAHGIVSRIDGKRILVGSEHFVVEDEGVDISVAKKEIEALTGTGYSVLYVAIEKELAGIIAIRDPLRRDAAGFVRMLKESGVKKVVMLTGDSDAAARNAAEKLDIKEYHAQVLPDTKTEVIRALKEGDHVVAMVGDGINDSPALSYADVGISMKHGADIAKEASDVLVLDGNLLAIIEARQISRKTMSLIRQNFRYTVGINSALIGLGLLGVITPGITAVAHNAATIAITLNSLGFLSKGTRSERGGSRTPMIHGRQPG
jgi:heavy metal translocating P-type ATPase